MLVLFFRKYWLVNNNLSCIEPAPTETQDTHGSTHTLAFKSLGLVKFGKKIIHPKMLH